MKENRTYKYPEEMTDEEKDAYDKLTPEEIEEK